VNVALVDIDSKIPNLALMKISAYHKAQGDEVEWFYPMKQYDRVYASKIFTNTPDNLYLPEDTIKGGTGYDLTTKLPDEIEAMCPDYSLYPNMDYALGFTSRGCIRKCPFCVAWKKEGRIKPVGDIYNFWRGQGRLKLLDNNLTALPEHFELIVKQLIKEKIKVDFSQGLDIRLITPEMAQLLSTVKLWKQIRFAFDNVKYEKAVYDGVKTLIDNGVAKHKIMFFVLIGFNSTPADDLYRVQFLSSLGVDPFVMPYNKQDPYQKASARWVNHKAIFKSVDWHEYKSRPVDLAVK